MAQLTLQEQTVDDTNLIAVVRIIMSLLRLDDDGSGNVDIITNTEALPIAQSFWDAYAGEFGLLPVEGDVTGQQYAQCIFKKLRQVFRDAHVTKAGTEPLDTYRTSLDSAVSTARNEIDSTLGTD